MDKKDANGDGKISASEFGKKRKFKAIDQDGDGFITLEELKIRFGEPIGAASVSDVDQTEEATDTGIAVESLDGLMTDPPDAVTVAAVERSKYHNPRYLKDRGLFETGLKPVWPGEYDCPGIDEWYSKDYTYKRPKEAYHGGIDIPVPFGTPVLAAMDGQVVGKLMGERSARGIELVLRHTPEQSGYPMYIYSRYAHFETMPGLKLGQTVKMGQKLGTTGNTGRLGCQQKGVDCTGKSRRPALHFDILYTESPKYWVGKRALVPYDAWWMDPNALYRKKLPVDSVAMKKLSSEEKKVPISFVLDTGERVPADTKMIWPYPCTHADADTSEKYWLGAKHEGGDRRGGGGGRSSFLKGF